jgi:pyruvate-ferredoxin/flavodoxin oxidoreductase
MLARSDPEQSRHLLALAQADADERWQYYEQLAAVTRAVPQDRSEGPAGVEEPPAADDGDWLQGGA